MDDTGQRHIARNCVRDHNHDYGSTYDYLLDHTDYHNGAPHHHYHVPNEHTHYDVAVYDDDIEPAVLGEVRLDDDNDEPVHGDDPPLPLHR